MIRLYSVKLRKKGIDILSIGESANPRNLISLNVFDGKQEWNVEKFIGNDEAKLVHVVELFSERWRVGRRLKSVNCSSKMLVFQLTSPMMLYLKSAKSSS